MSQSSAVGRLFTASKSDEACSSSSSSVWIFVVVSSVWSHTHTRTHPADWLARIAGTRGTGGLARRRHGRQRSNICAGESSASSVVVVGTPSSASGTPPQLLLDRTKPPPNQITSFFVGERYAGAVHTYQLEIAVFNASVSKHHRSVGLHGLKIPFLHYVPYQGYSVIDTQRTT